MIRRMRLRWLAVALGAISFGMAAVAFARASGWDVSYGDVGTWLSGIGSFAAAVAALKIAGDETRRYNSEKSASRREAEKRAIRRAKRIRFELGSSVDQAGEYNTHRVLLRNAGNTPIYDVTWYRPVIVARRSDTMTKVFRNVEIGRDGGEAPKPTYLNPDDTWRINYKHNTVPKWIQAADQPRQSAVTTAIPVMSFEDEDGNRLGFVVEESTSVRPDGKPYWDVQWALVDDDYPNSVGGILGDLLQQSVD
jgi:hypothetical protein